MSDRVDPALAERTQAVYEAAATGYDRSRSRRLYEQAWLDRFLALSPPGSPVLDLGCGAGDPIARYLLKSGRAVTGVDFAPAMLGIAAKRFPEARWIEADMRALDLGERFGGILAWDSLFHLTATDQRALFPVLARHLLPGGALLFTSGPEAGSVPGTVEGQTVYHASLSPAEYAHMLEASGLIARAFMAEDPACDRHSVWLAQARAAL